MHYTPWVYQRPMVQAHRITVVYGTLTSENESDRTGIAMLPNSKYLQVMHNHLDLEFTPQPLTPHLTIHKPNKKVDIFVLFPLGSRSITKIC